MIAQTGLALLVFSAILPVHSAQLPFLPFHDGLVAPRAHTWLCLGPIPSGTREETVLPDPGSLFERARAPSSVVDGGWTSPVLVEADRDGRVPLVYPDARWNYTRSYAGWSGLQHEVFCRRNVTLAGGVYRARLEGAQEFSIRYKSSAVPRWYFGNIYKLRDAPSHLLRLEPGKHEVTVRWAYDNRVFGDPAANLPTGTWSLDLQEAPEQLEAAAVRRPMLSTNHLPLGRYISISVANTLSERSCINAAFIGKTRLRLLDDSTVCVEPLQTRNVALALPDDMHFELRETVELSADRGHRMLSVPLEFKKQTSFDEPFLSTFRSAAGSISHAIFKPPASPSKCSEHVQVALHGAGVDVEGSSFWVDSVPPREAEWTVLPSGLTEWGWDWHGPSMRDVDHAIEHVEHVRRVWSKATRRQTDCAALKVGKVVVLGHSNGGQGAWHYIERRPDRVLGSVPASAYVKIQDYVPYHWTQAQHLRDPALTGILTSALTSFDNDLYASNLAHMPILIRHGADDDDVPAYHAKVMLKTIDHWAGGSSLTELSEVPATRHWFDDVFSAQPVQDFIGGLFSRAGMASNKCQKLPFTFTLTTANPNESGSLYGFKIVDLEVPGRLSRLDVTIRQDQGDLIGHVTARNVARFRFDELQAEEALGCRVATLSYGSHVATATDRVVTLKPAASRRYGPMYSILNTHEAFRIIVGTAGSKAETKALEDAARRIAFSALQFGQLDAIIVKDSQVDLESVHHGVLLGDAWTNLVILSYPAPRAFKLHDRVFNESGQALAFLTEHPKRRDGLLMVISGNGNDGLEQALRFWPARTGHLLPDWIIGDVHARDGGIVGAGFWTDAWQYSEQMSYL